MAKMHKEIKLIDVNKILPNPNQPRKTFDESALQELALSIKQCGVIQPLTVKASMGDMLYELVSGERRLRASKMAGLTHVPCVIVSADEESFEVMSLVENIQREDLSFIEEAKAYATLIEQYGMSQQELSQKVGKRQSTISNKLRILKLDDTLIEMIVEHNLTERHARALLNLPDSKMRLAALKEIVRRDLNVRQSEELIERLRGQVLLNSAKRNVKNLFNYKIYTNTIKQAYSEIVKTGMQAQYEENVFDDKIEVVITIPIEHTHA